MFETLPKSSPANVPPQKGQPFFSPVVQRSPGTGKAPEEKKGTDPVKSENKEEGGFNLGEWLHKKVYETIAKELGEAKLKEYAKEIAKKATDFIAAEAKKESGQATFVSEAMNKKLFEYLKEEVAKEAERILLSPEATKVKEAILKELKGNPAAALGAVLAAAAGAYLANVALKGDKSFDMDKGKKFKLDAAGDFGTIQDIDLKQLKLGLRYVGENFQSGISAEYGSLGKDKGEGVTGAASAKIGSKQNNVATEAQVKSNGEFTLKLKPEFTVGLVKLQGDVALSNATPKPIYGSALVRFGTDKNFLSSNVTFKPDGTLELGTGFSYKPPIPLRYVDLSVAGSLSYDPDKNLLKPNIGLTGTYKPQVKGHDIQLGLSGFIKAKDPSIPQTPTGLNMEVMITFTIFEKSRKK